MSKKNVDVLAIVITAMQISTSAGMRTKNQVVNLRTGEANSLIKLGHAKKATEAEIAKLKSSLAEKAKAAGQKRVDDINVQIDGLEARAFELMAERDAIMKEHGIKAPKAAKPKKAA